MRLDPWSPAIRVPPPTPLLIALVAIAFVSCELARSVAYAAPCDAAPAHSTSYEPSDVPGDDSVTPPATHGPAIASVLKAAYRAAGLDRDPSRGWIRRARLAGLIPWLTVRTGRDASWASDESSVDHGMALDLRATWRLDRLAFDGRELQVASIESARRRERRRLASRVIRAYFTWQRAAREGYRSGTRSTRALEAAAELDALTDGWFSESLVGPRRSASERRTP